MIADIVLATFLLLGGIIATFFCLLAGLMDPLGRSPWVTVCGPLAGSIIAIVLGGLWWAAIIAWRF